MKLEQLDVTNRTVLNKAPPSDEGEEDDQALVQAAEEMEKSMVQSEEDTVKQEETPVKTEITEETGDQVENSPKLSPKPKRQQLEKTSDTPPHEG